MNFIGAALMAIVIVVCFLGGIYEKKLRKEDLETYKIAAYLQFEEGYVKQIFSDELLLGAGKNSDVRIPLASKEVASIHAHIYRAGEYFHIENIVNGKPIIVKYVNEENVLHYGEKNILRDGSRIIIGNQEMMFKRGVK